MESSENIYLVEIQEILRRTVAVPANSHTDALDKTRTAYNAKKNCIKRR